MTGERDDTLGHIIHARATMTGNGRVTVPATIRKALGLKEGDMLTFTLANGVLRVGGDSVVERTRGIFKSNLPPLSERQLKDAAAQAIADDVYERMNR